MTSFILNAQPREKLGKSEARRIRKSGNIPAIIYSKDGQNTAISVDGREFEKEYFKGIALTSTAKLKIGGKDLEVIAHHIELDPVTDRPTHIDFDLYSKGTTIKAKPRLVFVNTEKSPGLKRGGFLHIVARRVTVLTRDATLIPEKIEIDVGTMQVGGKVRGNDLKLPNGVSLEKKNNFLIASIIGRGLKAEDTAETPAAGAEAAAGDAKADDKAAEKK